MRDSAQLARALGVRLHTHISETVDEERFCLERFGRRPVDLLEDLGYLGPDVWLAHCVHLNADEVKRIAATGTGVASCPTSNLRLASGIAPAAELIRDGAPVGLGVDGSASNDSGHLLAEVRASMLTQRAAGDASAMTARRALWAGTRGGAACLGRDDVGSLEVGKRGDVALFDVTGLPFVGARHDPVAGLVFCSPGQVRDLFVEGRSVVRDGELVTADARAIADAGHVASRRLLERK
jgi:cytosine/adenosine deaminase-related metal-dependent hydrolase